MTAYISDHAPDLVQRLSGGWIAKSSRHAALRIGVTAATAEEAREKYEQAVTGWKANLQRACGGVDRPTC